MVWIYVTVSIGLAVFAAVFLGVIIFFRPESFYGKCEECGKPLPRFHKGTCEECSEK